MFEIPLNEWWFNDMFEISWNEWWFNVTDGEATIHKLAHITFKNKYKQGENESNFQGKTSAFVSCFVCII